MTETPPRAEGVSRRRFLFVALAAAAGGAAAATLPVATLVPTGAPPDADEREPPSLPWDVRRRMILRAHDDVVLVGREEE